MKQITTIFLTIFVCAITVIAQEYPKREFRGAYLSTYKGLDWPSVRIGERNGMTHDEQRELQKGELCMILDSLRINNFNAVYFQCRTRCDAIYKSSYEPWSEDFVFTRGNEPGYDPLEFMVEECHKRGLEIYTWINPY
ncbi:MAG: family 10 glycosylhydrolase, partial [Muribaculaceae bacterium]